MQELESAHVQNEKTEKKALAFAEASTHAQSRNDERKPWGTATVLRQLKYSQ